ncbi:MAG: HD-GYP domain-containing protein [Clostridiales bacterium]|nr:HD-GYP domain-containing protein [Clostridiales bacterium]
MLIPMIVLVIQLTVVVQCRRSISRRLFLSLVLFTTLPILAGILQLKFYGLSLINITTGFLTSMLYLFALNDINTEVARARMLEVTLLKEEGERIRRLFDQTAQALASAIDAKDPYTKGHSSRVAEYSRKIAELAGKSQKECEEVYYAALLHDVGKIGVPRTILNKKGRLDDEEFKAIKQHPSIGDQILSSISESPYLSIGAKSHHERYDGRGYPEGLKGEDIPEIARIIAVADAYDAMTSNRSYRDTIPQQLVREEFVKCLGTQFDPVFGKIMLHLIDIDSEYQMKEKEDVKELAGKNELSCDDYRTSVSEGIIITREMARIRLISAPKEGYSNQNGLPSIVLFDSLDARIHEDEQNIEKLLYFEYGEIRFDGQTVCKGARKMETQITERGREAIPKKGTAYTVEAVKVRDHIFIRISSDEKTMEITIALPDSARWAYIGLTGEHCMITEVSIDRDEEAVPEDYIPRIAEEVSYIKVPAGDVPNIQVDGYRSAATDGILLSDKLTISFHTMSLPTARLIWHCPYFSIFSSEDGKVNGPDFREYSLIRLDGENWASNEFGTNKICANKTPEFTNWEKWKEQNRSGFDVTVTVERAGDTITLTTKNNGIEITNITSIKEEPEKVYIALTGDQCAITNIRISQGK